MSSDENFMREALEQAQQAFEEGEIPIGAILVKDGKVLCRSHNTREESKNPLHHAEILLLEEAGRILGDWRLTDTTLYVTVEPCPMCLGALLQARVGRVVYGCGDDKRKTNELNRGRFTFPTLEGLKELEGNNHCLQITGGTLAEECTEILQRFFRKKRKSNPI